MHPLLLGLLLPGIRQRRGGRACHEGIQYKPPAGFLSSPGYLNLTGFCFSQQFEAGESRVGVVQYSHDNTQELVAMGDANIDNIGALKQ